MSLEVKFVSLDQKKHSLLSDSLVSLQSKFAHGLIIKFNKKTINIEYSFDFYKYDDDPSEADKNIDFLMSYAEGISKDLEVAFKYCVQRGQYGEPVDGAYINGVEVDDDPQVLIKAEKNNKKFYDSVLSPFLVDPDEGKIVVERFLNSFGGENSLASIKELLGKLNHDQRLEFWKKKVICYSAEYNYKIYSHVTAEASRWYDSLSFNIDLSSRFNDTSEMKEGILLLRSFNKGKDLSRYLTDGFLIDVYINDCSDEYFQIRYHINTYGTGLELGMSFESFYHRLNAHISDYSIFQKEEMDRAFSSIEKKIKEFKVIDMPEWGYRLAIFYQMIGDVYRFPRRSAYNAFADVAQQGNLRAQIICANTCMRSQVDAPDLFEQLKYYLKLSAGQGYKESQENLALIENGKEPKQMVNDLLYKLNYFEGAFN
jgi:hypothetical protein